MHSSFFLKMLILLVGFSIASAGEHNAGERAITIPCPPLDEGNYWEYHTSSDWFEGASKSIVLLNDKKRVVVAIKENIGGKAVMGNATNTEREEEYEIREKGLYLAGYKMRGALTNYDPPIPYCGVIPSHAETTMRMEGSGMKLSVPQKTRLVTHGNEKVTVPAGVYDASVIEMITEVKPGHQVMMGFPKRTRVLWYVVENVGLVKIVIESSSQSIQVPERDKERFEELIKNGIAESSTQSQIEAIAGQLESENEGGRSESGRTVESGSTKMTMLLKAYSLVKSQ